MAVILSELFEQTREQFQLEVIAGADALEIPVSWVHLVEDTALASSIWGGELLLTTGIGQNGPHWLLGLLTELSRHQCSGIIVNTGPYIPHVPQEVIDFCNGQGLPLLTMPWHIYVSDIIKDFCMRIVTESQNDAVISQAVVNAIETPRDETRYLSTLQEYYNAEGQFQTIAFRLDYPADATRYQRTADIIRTMISRYVRRFTLMRYERFFVLVFNDVGRENVEQAAQQIILQSANRHPPLSAHVGVGTAVSGVRSLHSSYLRARAAARMADYFKLPLVHYRDMGLYQLLFTAEDPGILAEYYRDNLGVLEAYDRAHNTALLETFYQDLLCGGSIKAIAAAMYTHRNTINYRMGKIRELLASDLSDADERTRYRMAFYARDIVKKMNETQSAQQ